MLQHGDRLVVGPLTQPRGGGGRRPAHHPADRPHLRRLPGVRAERLQRVPRLLRDRPSIPDTGPQPHQYPVVEAAGQVDAERTGEPRHYQLGRDGVRNGQARPAQHRHSALHREFDRGRIDQFVAAENRGECVDRAQRRHELVAVRRTPAAVVVLGRQHEPQPFLVPVEPRRECQEPRRLVDGRGHRAERIRAHSRHEVGDGAVVIFGPPGGHSGLLRETPSAP